MQHPDPTPMTDPITLPPLSLRQRAVLDVILGHILANGGTRPLMREIGEALGIASTNGVNDHLNALERKGRIHRTPGSYEVLADSDGRPYSDNPRRRTLRRRPSDLPRHNGAVTLVRRAGEEIHVGDDVRITVIRTSQGYCTLQVESPAGVGVTAPEEVEP